MVGRPLELVVHQFMEVVEVGAALSRPPVHRFMGGMEALHRLRVSNQGAVEVVSLTQLWSVGRVAQASSSSRRFNSRLKLDGRDGKSPRSNNFRRLPGLWRGPHRSHFGLRIKRPDIHDRRSGHVDQSSFWNQNSR